MENGDLEERLNKVEDELANPANLPKTGTIIVRMFRYWLTEHWEPHNRGEVEYRAKIDRYIWGLRAMLWLMAGIAGVIAWSLETIIDIAQVLKLGAGGP